MNSSVPPSTLPARIGSVSVVIAWPIPDMALDDERGDLDHAGDHVREACECNQPGGERHHGELASLRARHHPDHRRDQKPGADAQDEGVERGMIREVHREIDDLCRRFVRHQIERHEADSDQDASKPVGAQHHAPDPGDLAKAVLRWFGSHRQYGGDRGFGEKLLAAQNDDQEPRRVAEGGNQFRPRFVGQVPADQREGENREAHRDAGHDA